MLLCKPFVVAVWTFFWYTQTIKRKENKTMFQTLIAIILIVIGVLSISCAFIGGEIQEISKKNKKRVDFSGHL